MTAPLLPLVAHVIHRLDVGGLENGLVNIINHMPEGRYRHAIICMTDYNSGFRARIKQNNVECHALHKREGKDPGIYFRPWRLFKHLRPIIVHTRNLSALEAQLPAALAGVHCRVQGEHGRDVHDIDGRNRKYNLLRRVFRPLVDRYIPLSLDLEQWLRNQIGVADNKIVTICNGVDSELFHPALAGREALPVEGFAGVDSIVNGQGSADAGACLCVAAGAVTGTSTPSASGVDWGRTIACAGADAVTAG